MHINAEAFDVWRLHGSLSNFFGGLWWRGLWLIEVTEPFQHMAPRPESWGPKIWTIATCWCPLSTKNCREPISVLGPYPQVLFYAIPQDGNLDGAKTLQTRQAWPGIGNMCVDEHLASRMFTTFYNQYQTVTYALLEWKFHFQFTGQTIHWTDTYLEKQLLSSFNSSWSTNSVHCWAH